MAKRKSNQRRRPGPPERRSGDPAPSVGRTLRLDDLLLPPTGASAAAPSLAPRPAPAPTSSAEPIPAPTPALEALPTPQADGPIIRLGAVWAVATFIAAGAGVVALAVWYAVVAALAALQACRSWRKRPREPVLQLAMGGAALIPLAAAVSLPAAVGAAGAVAITALFYRPDPRRSAPALTVLVAVGLGMAAAAPVLVRRLGLVEVIVLLSLVGVYDASAFLVGTGASRSWEGPVAGIAFMFAVALAAAAVFVPPFDGISPWVLTALAAGLAPLGPRAAQALLGEPNARVPAVRRLDSLLLLGPLWTAAAYLLL